MAERKQSTSRGSAAGCGYSPLVLLALVALEASRRLTKESGRQWLSDALLNVGFIVLGLVVAVLIGETLIANAERRNWAPVESAIKGRAFRAAMAGLLGFANAPAIRSELGDRGVRDLPEYGQLADDYGAAFAFVFEKLMPAIKRYTILRPPPRTTVDFIGFKDLDWAIIRNGIDEAAGLTTQLLMISGAHQGPSLQTAVLQMDAALQQCQRALLYWDGQEYQGSGAGAMAHQVWMLESFERFVEAAVDVVDELRDSGTGPRKSKP